VTAYVIAEVEIDDPHTYAAYRAQTPGVVAKYGGTFIVRGGEVQSLEGDWQPGRLVVIAFPDMATAQRFYDSPDYQAIVGLRHQAARSRLIIVDGHDAAR
jgi:uncharacterized protein (DUF1330 family)